MPVSIWLVILLAAGLFYWYWTRLSRKARPLKLGDVVQVSTMHRADLDLPLGNLGIFVKHNVESRQSHVIFPTLTSSDQVRYVDRSYDQNAISWAVGSNSLQRQKIALLAPVIEEHLELERRIKRIEKYQHKLDDALRLASTSKTHAETSENLKRKLAKISDWMAKTHQIEQSSLSYIRDVLIANELEESAPDLIEASPQLRAEYHDLRQIYRALRDDAEIDFPDRQR
jgi:F0F1-type ATP synthase epsilon subunit